MKRKKILISLILLLISCDFVRSFIISDEDEIELGEKFKAQILADTKTYPPYRGSTVVQKFVDSIGTVIANSQKDRKSLKFTFTILEDTSINAFAVPGGHVFVYTGLLRNIENSAELAGVLAHEIGHITKYHGVNQLVQGQFIEYVNQILFGDDSSVIAAVTCILEDMTFMRLSQRDEFEADSLAVAYTTLAGINPVGMKHFLSKLRNKYGDTPTIFEPFSSHPPMKDRISKVAEVISRTPGVPSDSTTYLFRDQYVSIKELLK